MFTSHAKASRGGTSLHYTLPKYKTTEGSKLAPLPQKGLRREAHIVKTAGRLKSQPIILHFRYNLGVYIDLTYLKKQSNFSIKPSIFTLS